METRSQKKSRLLNMGNTNTTNEPKSSSIESEATLGASLKVPAEKKRLIKVSFSVKFGRK